MNLKKYSLTAIALCAVLCAAACGSSDVSSQTAQETKDASATAAESETDETETAEQYPYETADLGGYEFRVLNSDIFWNMNITVDTKETTGEVLNDAIYNRNRRIENDLNCTFNVTLVDIEGNGNDPAVLSAAIKQSVLAGADEYDIMYAPIYTTPGMVTDGYFMNLYDVEGLNLTEKWWDSYISEAATIEGSLYFTSSPMQLMTLEGGWCLFFNENIMDRNDMEKPYQLVRDGKWTIDKLLDYCKEYTNMNGDSSFKWDQNGSAVYGISSHEFSADKFILGTGEYLVQKDADNGLVFSAPSDERLANVLSSLAQLLDNTNGYTIYSSNEDFDAAAGGYIYIFSVGRSLFLTAEIKAAQELRDMDDTFGIVPYPKYDESQDSYYSSFVTQCLYYTIPVTNTHLKETAMISDYTSFMSYRDVLPVYYGNTVEQKGLRNQDSIEMLDIIRSTSTVDLSVTFGWTSSLMSSIRTSLFKGDGDLASTFEKKTSTVEKSITKTVTAIRELQENG